jgi:hypothetical protein
VKRSRGAKLFLAAALVVTLGLKLLLHDRGTAAADQGDLGEAVARFLNKTGFEPHLETKFGRVFIHAKAGKCRLLISEATPQGWDKSSNEIWAKPIGRLSYIFDGAVHADEPFVAPMLDRWWMRVRVKMGLSANRHPLLAVAASDDCTINALPWWELAVQS